MADGIERILAQALAQGRILVGPTNDELRQRAEELMQTGRLTCTFCRKPITDVSFTTRRLRGGPRHEWVANLHPACEEGFSAATVQKAETERV